MAAATTAELGLWCCCGLLKLLLQGHYLCLQICNLMLHWSWQLLPKVSCSNLVATCIGCGSSSTITTTASSSCWSHGSWCLPHCDGTGLLCC
jgi:hypothetical protein